MLMFEPTQIAQINETMDLLLGEDTRAFGADLAVAKRCILTVAELAHDLPYEDFLQVAHFLEKAKRPAEARDD